MNNHKSIAQNSGLQIISKILSTVLGIVALAVMTRALGAEKYGWYVTAASFMQFIGILADFGFMLITSQMLAQGEYAKDKILNTLFTWRFISAFLFYGTASAVIWLFPYSPDIKIAAGILSFSFFFITLNQVLTGYYQYKLKMFIPSLGEVLGRIVLVLSVVFLATKQEIFMPMMAAVSLASFIFFLFLFFKSPAIHFQIDKTVSKIAFAKMWPLALSIMFNSVYLLGDRVILPLFVSQEQIGYYGASYRVLDIFLQIIALTMAIIMPVLSSAWAKQQLQEFKEHLQISFEMLGLFIFPMIAGTLALANEIMVFVAGRDFFSSGKILFVLTFAILGIYLGQIGGHIMLSMNRQKKSLVVFILTSILGVIGYFIFIPKFGVWGAAGVTIGTEVFAGILLITLSFYYAKFIPKISTLLKIIFVSTLMGVFVHYLPSPHVLISIFYGLVIYSLLIIITQTVKLKTIKEIFNKTN